MQSSSRLHKEEKTLYVPICEAEALGTVVLQ